MHRSLRQRVLLAAVALLSSVTSVITLVDSPAVAATNTATFTKVSDWGTGWEGKVVITNGGPAAIDGWTVQFDLPSGTSITSHWEANRTSNGTRHTFTNVAWNKVIQPGASVTFGMIGAGPGNPTNCTLNGADCAGGPGPGPSPSSPGPSSPPPSSPAPGVPPVPGDVRVTGTTDTSISLAWSASTGATGYHVYEGNAVRSDVTGTTATVTAAACTSHSYEVVAVNAVGESPRSPAVSATTTGCPVSQLPKHSLTGYWHNFTNPSTELRLRDVPDTYDVVAIAFAEATATPGAVRFAVDPGLSAALGGYTDEQLKTDVLALKSRGKKVILSVGGEAGRVSVSDAASANAFATSVHAIMQSYGLDGVDLDLENGLNPTYMAQALRSLRASTGASLIITMAPQTIDMQNTAGTYFALALAIKDILTVVHMQYYNSGAMLGCDQAVVSQGTLNFLTSLACIQLENGLRPDQVALGLPAGPGAAGGGVVAPSMVTDALNCLARAQNCRSFRPPRTYPDIRGAMAWSINWDVTNGNTFANTVKPFLTTLP
jgi:chitinase